MASIDMKSLDLNAKDCVDLVRALLEEKNIRHEMQKADMQLNYWEGALYSLREEIEERLKGLLPME